MRRGSNLITDSCAAGSAPDPDCARCIHRKEGCEQAMEGTWCTRFQSRDPRDRGMGPSEAWEKGLDDPDMPV